MSIQPALEDRETPADAWDIGFLSYHLRTAFRDMRRLVGLDEAQNIMAEIILDERKRQSQ